MKAAKASTAASDSFERYQISVIDDGCGISLEDSTNLFKPITLNSNLANKNRQANVKSNGIGLSISQCIAKKLGGNLILVPSTEGTHFVLEIRAERIIQNSNSDQIEDKGSGSYEASSYSSFGDVD